MKRVFYNMVSGEKIAVAETNTLVLWALCHTEAWVELASEETL